MKRTNSAGRRRTGTPTGPRNVGGRSPPPPSSVKLSPPGKKRDGRAVIDAAPAPTDAPRAGDATPTDCPHDWQSPMVSPAPRLSDSVASRGSAESSMVVVSAMTTPAASSMPVSRVRDSPTAAQVEVDATGSAAGGPIRKCRPLTSDPAATAARRAAMRTSSPKDRRPPWQPPSGDGAAPRGDNSAGREKLARVQSAGRNYLELRNDYPKANVNYSEASQSTLSDLHTDHREGSSASVSRDDLGSPSTAEFRANVLAQSTKLSNNSGALPLSRGRLPVNTGAGVPSSPGALSKKPTARSAATPTSCTTSHLDQLEQMESVMDYVDSITQALAERRRGLPPPASLTAFRGTITPAASAANGGTDKRVTPGSDAGSLPSNASGRLTRGSSAAEEEEAHYSLMSSLHDASRSLLGWYSKLEYTKLMSNDSLPDLERGTLQSCTRVLTVVETVDRKFTTHEDADLRIAFKERRKVVLACQEYVDSLTQTAQQIVVLRRLTAAQDLCRVSELYEELKEVMQRRVLTASSALSAKYLRLMVAGPFFEWLQQRWLPAMRSWRRIVLDARQTASGGDVEGALATAQQEALSIPALQDILRPGETISELHHSQIEQPLMQLAKTFDKKKAIMDALEAAMAAPQLVELGKAIQASQDYALVKSRTQDLSAEDEARIKQAQQLLCDLQESEVVRRGVEAALQSSGGTAVTLFQPLQRANELICRLGLAQSPALADKVVRASKAVVARLTSIAEEEGGSNAHNASNAPGSGDGLDALSSVTASSTPLLCELLTSTVAVQDLCLVHIPSKVWSAETSASYQQLCQALIDVTMREQVRRDLQKAMLADGGAVTPSAAPGGLTNSSLRDISSVNTPSHDDEDDLNSNGRRTASSATTPRNARGRNGAHWSSTIHELEELQLKVKRAEEMDVTGPLIDKARTRIAQLNTIRLKVHFDAQARIVPVTDPDSTSFDSIYERLFADCVQQQSPQTPPPLGSEAAPSQRLRVRYEDLDGDYITLLNDADWQMMLDELAPKGQRAGTKIEVYCDFLMLPGAARTADKRVSPSGSPPPAPSPSSSQPQQQQQQQQQEPPSPQRAAAVREDAAEAVPRQSNNSSRARSPVGGPTRGTVESSTNGAGARPARPSAQEAAGGRTGPAMNNAARLRAASRRRYGSPQLTRENLSRSQSAYGYVGPAGAGARRSPAGGNGAPARYSAEERRQSPRQSPPALVHQQGADAGRDGQRNQSDREPSAGAWSSDDARALAGVVALDLDSGKRWGDDDDVSRLSALELQTVASVSTIMPSRMATQQRSPLAVMGGEGIFTAQPGRAGATGQRAQPPRQKQQQQQRERSLEARLWRSEDGEGSVEFFDDIHTIYSENSRIPGRGGSLGTTATLDGAGTADSEHEHGGTVDSEKENAALPQTALHGGDKSLCIGGKAGQLLQQKGATIGVLPPRPDPRRRTGTPTRPRAARGAHGRTASACDEDAAGRRQRAPQTVLDEMEQMRGENLRAMRTPTPRRAWH